VFETCTGIFRPTVGVLRNLYYPDEGIEQFYLIILFISNYLVRVTIMNYMRVPYMVLMLIVLLGVRYVPYIYSTVSLSIF